MLRYRLTLEKQEESSRVWAGRRGAWGFLFSQQTPQEKKSTKKSKTFLLCIEARFCVLHQVNSLFTRTHYSVVFFKIDGSH